jgi:hypothetical protein
MAVDENKSSFILDGNADGLIATMKSGVTAVETGTAQIIGTIDRIGGSVNNVIGLFGTLGAVIAGGAAFKSIVSETVSWDLETAKLAKTLGDTTENASIFKVALHSLGIDQDVAISAAMRMARTMNSNADAFKQIGVDIDGMRKAGKSNIEMMMATIEALGQYKGGLDRNQAAMTIFGRSWGELQQLMKLTPETFDVSREKAERLHLIVGPEGAAKAKQYKEALADLELVKKSVAHTAGTELVLALTDMAVMMEGPATKAAHILATGIHGVHDAIRDTIRAHKDWKESVQTTIDLKTNNALTLFLAARAAMTGHYDMIPTILGAGYQAGKNLRHNDMDMSDMTMDGVPDPGKKGKPWKPPGGSIPAEKAGSGGLTIGKLVAWMDGYWALVDEREFQTTLADSASLGFALAKNKSSLTDLNWQPKRQTFSLLGGDSAGWKQGTPEGETQAAERYATLQQSLMTENELLRSRYLERQSIVDEAHRYGLISDQEYERNKLQLQKDYDDESKKASLDEWKDKLSYANKATSGMMSLTEGLVTFSHKKSREMFLINKMAASANAIVHTAEGVTEALAYEEPYGLILAGIVAAAGAVQIANIASSSFEGGGTVSGPSTTSNGSSLAGNITSSGVPVTQPVNATPTQTGSMTINVHFNGNVLADRSAMEKWTEEELAPLVRSAIGRNVNFGFTTK